MKFASLLAALIVFAAPVHATPVTYQFNGPAFDSFNGAFSNSNSITGALTFDSSVFDSTGAAALSADQNNIGVFQWRFQDGFSTFSDVLTTSNFLIQMTFENFIPTYWNIDTTFGVTPGADIFVTSNGNYISYYQGAYAESSIAANTAFNWVNASADVPEPSTIMLMALGLIGIGAAVRRKQ